MGVNLANRHASVTENEKFSKVGIRKRRMPMKTFGGEERRMEVFGCWGPSARRRKVAWVDMSGVGGLLGGQGDRQVSV